MKLKKYTLSDLSIDNKGTYGISAPAVDYSKDKYTYLRITDITDDGRFSQKDLKSVDDINADKYILQPNDIVFARTGGSTGRNYFYDGKDGKNIVYAGFLIKFSINPELVNPKYIKYYCQSKTYKDWVNSFNTGSTRGNINAKTYENMEILLPSKKQQNFLVKILEKIDDKIELNNKINKNLEQQAQAMFYEIYNKGTKGKLEDIISEIETGSRPKGGALSCGIPSIGAENINGFGKYDYSKDKYISEGFYKNLRRGIVKSGDVLLYKDGAYTGKVSMSLNDFPHKKCAVNEHVFIIRTNKVATQFFLYFCLLDDANRQKINMLASGKAAQPGLNQNELKSIPILIPSIDNIKNFTSNVAPIMYSIALNSTENNKFVQLRDTLLPKLMNGEIDVDKINI